MIKLSLSFVRNKKAAMFGLDARIALAIFGALSVISGAALYSAIQQAKVVQWQTYFSELAKASEAYYLDVGNQLPTYYGTGHNFTYIGDLVENRESIDNWKGPYIDGNSYSHLLQNSFTRRLGASVQLYIWLRVSDTWASYPRPASNEMCSIGASNCSEWIALFPGSSSDSASVRSVFDLLDEKIDNGDGLLSGNIRYSTYSHGTMFYKGMNHTFR